MKNKFSEPFLIFIRGILMGSADIVPGVSGGTIALITGIYEHLIYSISKINFSFLKPLFKGDLSQFKVKLFGEIDFKFFIPLLSGIGLAVITISKLIIYAMEVHTAITFSFFLGLITASAYILFTHIHKVSIKHVIITIIGLVLAYIFVSLNPIATNHTLPVLFISGLIAICAMILPGISGSFLLLLLGQYKYMLNSLQSLNIVEIITFILGAAIGILSFSKLLNYLLENYEEMTMAFLIGIMLGTLKIPVVQISKSISFSFSSILVCFIVAIIGLAIVVVLETKFDYIE